MPLDREASGHRRFVPLPLDKHAWAPSPLPGQIVLVTTISPAGLVDVAPKSWVSLAAFNGPVIGFGCNTSHLTCSNVTATGEFVINVVPSGLAAQVWRLADLTAAERITGGGLTFSPGTTVAPPRVLDCVAHFECRHLRTVGFDGGEVFIFGTVVSATIDARCLVGDVGDDAAAYRALDPCFYLQERWYSSLGPALPVPAEPGDNHQTATRDST